MLIPSQSEFLLGVHDHKTMSIPLVRTQQHHRGYFIVIPHKQKNTKGQDAGEHKNETGKKHLTNISETILMMDVYQDKLVSIAPLGEKKR